MRPMFTMADLERWQDNGATWRVLEVTDNCATVELRTCYGEAVDTVQGNEPELIEYVRTRREG